MAQSDFILWLSAELQRLLGPLTNALQSEAAFAALLLEYGWSVDAAGFSVGEVGQALEISSDLEAAEQVAAEVFGAGSAPTADQIATLVQALRTVVKDVQDASSTTAPAGLESLWSTFTTDLPPGLLADYFGTYHPRAQAALLLIGVITEQQVAPPAGSSDRVAYTRRTVDWSRLAKSVSNPVEVMSEVYGWNATSGAFQPMVLIAALERSWELVGLHAGTATPSTTLLDTYYTASNPARATASQLVLTLFNSTDPDANISFNAGVFVLPAPPPSDRSQPPTGLVIGPSITGSTDPNPMLAPVSVELDGELSSDSAITLELQPGSATASLATGSGDQIAAEARVSATVPTLGLLLGTPWSHRIEGGGAYVGIRIAGALDAPEVVLELGVDTLRLVFDPSDGADGFLTQLLGGQPQTIDLSGGLEWSSRSGLHFAGQGTLTLHISINKTLGPISLDSATMELAADTAGTVNLIVGITGRAGLGPVQVAVTNVGVIVELKPVSAGGQTTLGDMDLVLAFKPPDGLELALVAPGVSGVGYLAFDGAAARYLGAAALSIGPVSISAIGVLDTRLPSGAEGYSLVVLASVVFPPVQLGFGFSLIGVGGLVGVNRTTNVPGLQTLARAGGLDSLMFPSDIVHHAPQLASNLGTLFPAAQGHFIIGPALRLTWGTSGILDIEVGVLIELSDLGGGVSLLRIALLGWVHMTLPDAKAPIADITLDILGLVDIPAKTLSIDGGLRNSKVAGFTLTGQMAVRAGWGADASFVLALGGFNPHFSAPAGFPQLNRLALSLGGNNPRLRLSAYLALTSNTLQLGAAADLYAAAGPAAVAASASFDALVQFKPFGLIIDLSVSASFLLNGSPVLSLSLALHLSGPDPWHVTGKASIQVLFWSVSVPINLQIGPSPAPQPAQTVDLDANLAAALADPHNWQTSLPTGTDVVVLTGGAAQDSSALHPMGSLTLRQSAAPLDTRIDRYGPDLLDTPCTYALGTATLSGDTAASTAVTGQFAPAQFITLSDDQKLSAPSFEALAAGATLTPAATGLPLNSSSPPTVADAVSSQQWQLILFDSPDPPGPTTAPAATTVPAATPTSTTSQPTAGDGASIDLPPTLLFAQLAGAAASVNGSAGRGAARYAGPAPSAIALTDPRYLVVGMNLADPELAASNAAAVDLMASASTAAMPSQVIQVSELPGG